MGGIWQHMKTAENALQLMVPICWGHLLVDLWAPKINLTKANIINSDFFLKNFLLRKYCIDTEALVFMFNGGSSYGFTIHPDMYVLVI